MKSRYKRRRGKQITNARKTTYDGVSFSSGLEAYCYKRLQEAGIEFGYESVTFEVMPKFNYEGDIWDKGKSKGKKVFKQKSGNIRNISYTPDFVSEEQGFIIETKGLRTPEFNMRFKLFFKHLKDNDLKYDVYIPSNQKEVDETVKLIKSKLSR